MADVTVLKTGQMVEADMLACSLEDAGVPFYRRVENFCGTQYAMPAMTAQGPGVFFLVLVPEGAAADAKEILAGLPITPKNPGLWSFSPKPRNKSLFQIYAVIVLVIMLLAGAATLIDFFKHLTR